MSKELKQVTQVDLAIRYDDQTVAHMTTWLDADPRIKEGVRITLKEDKREWTILKVYNTMYKHTVDNRGWDNNNYDKHDGTALKDRLKK